VVVPHPQNSVVNSVGLHQRRRRGCWCRGPAAAQPLRVLPAGLSRHGRCSRLLQRKAEQRSQHLEAPVLLGAHESRCSKYW